MTESNKYERVGRELYNRLVQEVPNDYLWPVIVGLVQKVLLNKSATMADYHYGVFALTDTLRDAAELQLNKGEYVQEDIQALARLRKQHLALSFYEQGMNAIRKTNRNRQKIPSKSSNHNATKYDS